MLYIIYFSSFCDVVVVGRRYSDIMIFATDYLKVRYVVRIQLQSLCMHVFKNMYAYFYGDLLKWIVHFLIGNEKKKKPQYALTMPLKSLFDVVLLISLFKRRSHVSR